MSFTYIRLHSGKKFDFINPDPSEIDIKDIAYSLSGKCRFNDHTNQFYSVAQHCCLCADNVDDIYKFDALMHDASEAYLQDIPSPLKALIPEYKAIEKGVEGIIAEKFNLAYPHPPQVKAIDMIMLVTEMRDFMPGDDRKCLTFEPLDESITGWDRMTAYIEFMNRYEKFRRDND